MAGREFRPADREGRRAPSPACRDPAREIEEPPIPGDAGPTANAGEISGARPVFQREDGCAGISGRRGEGSHRRASAVEETEIRFETPDVGSPLPVVASLRADRDARPREGRRNKIIGRGGEAARRLQPLGAVERKARAEIGAEIEPRPVERRRRRVRRHGGHWRHCQQERRHSHSSPNQRKKGGLSHPFHVDCLAQKAPGNHRNRAVKTALSRQYRGCV